MCFPLTKFCEGKERKREKSYRKNDKTNEKKEQLIMRQQKR